MRLLALVMATLILGLVGGLLIQNVWLRYSSRLAPQSQHTTTSQGTAEPEGTPLPSLSDTNKTNKVSSEHAIRYANTDIEALRLLQQELQTLSGPIAESQLEIAF